MSRNDAPDRPVSYIVRHLSLRGLALYKKDGLLKLTESEEKAIINGKTAPTDNAQVVGVPVTPPLEEVKKRRKVG
jgi:hypothetical protein